MGVNIEAQLPKVVFGNINVHEWSRIALPPHMALTTDSLRTVFPEPSTVTVSQRSTVLVYGKGSVVITRTIIDGALVISVPNENDTIVLEDAVIENKGWSFTELGKEDVPESLKIRGYGIARSEQCAIIGGDQTGGRQSGGGGGGGGVHGKFEGSIRLNSHGTPFE